MQQNCKRIDFFQLNIDCLPEDLFLYINGDGKAFSTKQVLF